MDNNLRDHANWSDAEPAVRLAYARHIGAARQFNLRQAGHALEAVCDQILQAPPSTSPLIRRFRA